MDFAWLEALRTVARTGGFSRAAAELHLSQPGVSRQIQRLERELGVRLLERGGGVRLTPAGEKVLEQAAIALAARDAMRAAAGEHTVAGPLRIAASTTPGEFLVPALVAGFLRDHPRVEPHVLIADTAVVEDEVRAGRWDVGFVGARLAPAGLRYRHVIEDEVVLAVPAGDPLAARGEVAVADLAGVAFIDREGGSGTAASVRRILGECGLAVPDRRPVMTLGSAAAVVAAVERGLGAGWVSTLALAGRNPERIAAVRIAGVPLRRSLYLVEAATGPRSVAGEAFAAWVARWRPGDAVPA